jgi:hypothetical protein
MAEEKKEEKKDVSVEKISELSAENQKLRDIITQNAQKRKVKREAPKITGLKGLKGFIS